MKMTELYQQKTERTWCLKLNSELGQQYTANCTQHNVSECVYMMSKNFWHQR